MILVKFRNVFLHRGMVSKEYENILHPIDLIETTGMSATSETTATTTTSETTETTKTTDETETKLLELKQNGKNKREIN